MKENKFMETIFRLLRIKDAQETAKSLEQAKIEQQISDRKLTELKRELKATLNGEDSWFDCVPKKVKECFDDDPD